MGGGPLQRKAEDMKEGGESKEGQTEAQRESVSGLILEDTQTKKKEAGIAVIERARAKAEAAKKGEQDENKTATEEEELESPVTFADANKDVKTLALRRQCTELGVDRTGSRANLLERLGALDAAAKAAAKAKSNEEDAKEEDVKKEEHEGGASGANELIGESERGSRSVCPECDELVPLGKTECEMCGTEVAVEMAGTTGDAIDATEGKEGKEGTDGSDGESGGGGGRSVLVLRRGLGAAELTEAAATTADLTAIRASGGQHIAWKRGSTGKTGKTSFLQFYEEGKDLAETQTVRATPNSLNLLLTFSVARNMYA